MNVKKRVSSWKFLLLGVLIIVFIVLVVLTYTKDCGEDRECFDDAVQRGLKAKTISYDDMNKYLYEVDGSRDDNCMITVHLLEVGMEVDAKIKDRLVNKGMVCEVPVGVDMYNVKELSVFCTGPLKEVLLQMTVERLYGFVIENFGQNVVQEQLDDKLLYDVLNG